MEKDTVIISLSALAHDVRLDMVGLLHMAGPSGMSLDELSGRLGLSGQVLSFHLDQLVTAGLVHPAGGDHTHYLPDEHAIDKLVGYLRGLGSGDVAAEEAPEPERVFDVLFLCKGNSARSIMAESIMRRHGPRHFRAYSAGYEPAFDVNPLALKVLADYDYPTDGLHTKSWQDFANANAPVMDFVFILCDETAAQPLPAFPGHPMVAHWEIEDPVIAEGTDMQKERAFVQAFKYLRTRLTIFLSLPISSLDKLALSARLSEIGHSEGETAASAAKA
jgi:arsenate reductase